MGKAGRLEISQKLGQQVSFDQINYISDHETGKFSSKFKAKVVMEALSERYTPAKLSERHKIHPNQISTWKSQFIANAELVFDKGV